MKKLLQMLMFLIATLLQIQLRAQPVDTPDYTITTEFNIDQYNPSIFVNPWNPDEVINSNIKYNHTIQGQVISYSLQPSDFFQTEDAGNSWIGNSLPTSCTTDNYPAVQINHDGRYYVNYGDQNAGIFIAWSDNKGSTWQQKQLKAKPDKPFYYVMNNNFWIDNSQRSMHRGNVYAVWRFIAYEAHDYCIEFCRSEYGSEEWSNPVNICENEPTNGTFEEWPVVQTGPFGEVYACWMNHNNGPGSGETSIGFNYSYDGGKTFGTNYDIANNIRGLSSYQNLIGLNLISAPSMAVDISGGPNDGKIYIVWANVGVPGINTGQDVDIYMIHTDSYGGSWSQPAKVNQDVAGLSKEHFMPT
ncbi:MAG: sialidase family protein, partial [Bacteroidales bacterium]